MLEPFVAFYATYDSMPSIILTLETDGGAIGYGESVVDGHIIGKTTGEVVEALKAERIPAVTGLDRLRPLTWMLLLLSSCFGVVELGEGWAA